MNQIALLDLIANGETEDLLLQKNRTLRLNALTAIGLIDICESLSMVYKGNSISPISRKIRNNILLEVLTKSE